jgi:hypothetical protein
MIQPQLSRVIGPPLVLWRERDARGKRLPARGSDAIYDRQKPRLHSIRFSFIWENRTL